MFRRLGIFLSVIGITMTLGAILIIGFDFASHISFLSNVSDLMIDMGGLGYVLAAVCGIVILVTPVDSYYLIWGDSQSINLSPPLSVTFSLLLFFGIIGSWIGYRTSGHTSSHPLLESVVLPYVFMLVFYVGIFAVINIIGQMDTVGSILFGIIEGATSRSIEMVVFTGVLFNGTIIAVFSAFVNVLLTSPNSDDMCDPGDLDCDIRI